MGTHRLGHIFTDKKIIANKKELKILYIRLQSGVYSPIGPRKETLMPYVGDLV